MALCKYEVFRTPPRRNFLDPRMAQDIFNAALWIYFTLNDQTKSSEYNYSVELTLLATMSIFISAVLIMVSHSRCLVWLQENILVDLQLLVSLYIFSVDFRTR